MSWLIKLAQAVAKQVWLKSHWWGDVEERALALPRTRPITPLRPPWISPLFLLRSYFDLYSTDLCPLRAWDM